MILGSRKLYDLCLQTCNLSTQEATSIPTARTTLSSPTANWLWRQATARIGTTPGSAASRVHWRDNCRHMDYICRSMDKVLMWMASRHYHRHHLPQLLITIIPKNCVRLSSHQLCFSIIIGINTTLTTSTISFNVFLFSVCMCASLSFVWTLSSVCPVMSLCQCLLNMCLLVPMLWIHVLSVCVTTRPSVEFFALVCVHVGAVWLLAELSFRVQTVQFPWSSHFSGTR